MSESLRHAVVVDGLLDAALGSPAGFADDGERDRGVVQALRPADSMVIIFSCLRSRCRTLGGTARDRGGSVGTRSVV